jgi:hypothetical protein
MNTIGIVAVDGLRGSGHNVAAAGGDHLNAAADQIVRQFGEPIVMAIRPAEFDRKITAFDISLVRNSGTERGDKRGIRVGAACTQETDRALFCPSLS